MNDTLRDDGLDDDRTCSRTKSERKLREAERSRRNRRIRRKHEVQLQTFYDFVKSKYPQLFRRIKKEIAAEPIPSRAPYKHIRNFAELPLGSTFTVSATGFNGYYGIYEQRFASNPEEIEDDLIGTEQHDENITDPAEGMRTKTESAPRKEKLGNPSAALDRVRPLATESSRLGPVKTLAAEIAEHSKFSKRELLSSEDCEMYKVETSKPEDHRGFSTILGRFI